MKEIKTYIFEKLTVSKPTYALFPKSKEELEEMIEYEISKGGDECSLNHINVSKITDMADLFFLDPNLMAIYLIGMFLMLLIWIVCFTILSLMEIYLTGTLVA